MKTVYFDNSFSPQWSIGPQSVSVAISEAGVILQGGLLAPRQTILLHPGMGPASTGDALDAVCREEQL